LVDFRSGIGEDPIERPRISLGPPFLSGSFAMNKTRRSLLASVLAAAFTLTVTVGTALAAELMGTIKTIDVDAKKIVVTEKDTDKDVEVTVTDETEWVTKKKTSKIDLTKVKKGQMVLVTHEDAKASKIELKKNVPKKEIK